MSGFPCRASGSNYLAEAVALLAALLSVPAEFDLNIYTDALSVKQSVERGLVMDWLAGALSGEYAITQRSRVYRGAAGAQCDPGGTVRKTGPWWCGSTASRVLTYGWARLPVTHE